MAIAELEPLAAGWERAGPATSSTQDREAQGSRRGPGGGGVASGRCGGVLRKGAGPQCRWGPSARWERAEQRAARLIEESNPLRQEEKTKRPGDNDVFV